MPEKLTAYIINESKGPETTPDILESNKQVCKFRVNTMQEGDIVNRNSRIYPYVLLEEGVQKDHFINERLSTGTLYCEIGHPKEKSIPRQLEIMRDNSACRINSFFFKKPVIGAILETLATDKGRDLMGLITVNRCKVAFSMRGLGKVVEQNGKFMVQKPFRIITWDEVVQPSVSNAYLSEVLSESVANIAMHRDGNRVELNEKLIALSEESLKEYLFSSDKKLQSLCEQLGVEKPKDKIVLNENGTISIYDNGRTIHTNTTTFIRNELHSFLRSLK